MKLQKKTVKALERQQVPRRVEGQKKVAFFSHLHQYERSFSITKEVGYVSFVCDSTVFTLIMVLRMINIVLICSGLLSFFSVKGVIKTFSFKLFVLF